MSLEVQNVQSKTEAALTANSEKPDFSEVYKDLSNNTTAAEQQAERKAFNDAVDKKFPNVELVGQLTLKDGNKPEQNVLLTFDTQTKSQQMRNVKDFSVLNEQSLADQMKQKEATSEQVVAVLNQGFDMALEQQYKSNKDGSQETVAPDLANENQVDPKVPGDENSTSKKEMEKGAPATTDAVEKDLYTVKPGDCLWNIAKERLQSGTGDEASKTASDASIRDYVDKIVALNKEQIKNEDLIYPGQKFRMPDVDLKVTPKKTLDLSTKKSNIEEKK